MLKKVWGAIAADPPASWDEARGAVDAADLSARRLGWCFTDFETMCTDQGTTTSLATTSPSLLAKLLREAVQRKWQRQMATGLSQNGWIGSRVSPHTIVRYEVLLGQVPQAGSPQCLQSILQCCLDWRKSCGGWVRL